MSLLNDMLRDLSHQQKGAEPAITAQQPALDLNAAEQRELFYNSSAAKPLPRTLVPSLIMFVAVLAILVFWKLSNVTHQVAGESVIVSPVAEQILALSESVAIEESNVSEPTIVAPAVTESALDEPALGERIAALESAITQLSTVVANVNNQSTAEAVVTATIESETQDEKTNLQVVEQEFQIEEKSLEEMHSDTTAESLASVSIQEPFASPVDDYAPVLGEPKLSIAPNAKWQDQQQAQQANQLVTQGQADMAVEKLQRFIATATQPRESVKTLLDIFATQERIESMQTVLAQANYLPLITQTFYAAKIAVVQQQDGQAIQLLEAHLDEAEQDENYRALLAGLYQRTGMNLEAANHYRRLLGVFGDKPAYWLGFALAQDALNQPQVAAQAYQRVNQYTDLQPQVRTYVQQRIAALQP